MACKARNYAALVQSADMRGLRLWNGEKNETGAAEPGTVKKPRKVR